MPDLSSPCFAFSAMSWSRHEHLAIQSFLTTFKQAVKRSSEALLGHCIKCINTYSCRCFHDQLSGRTAPIDEREVEGRKHSSARGFHQWLTSRRVQSFGLGCGDHKTEIMTRQVVRLLAPLRAGLRSTGSAGHSAAPWCALSSRAFASNADLKKTPLYDFHVEHGGNNVSISGSDFPNEECKCTRTCLSKAQVSTWSTFVLPGEQSTPSSSTFLQREYSRIL